MLGGMLAGHDEGKGKIVKVNGTKYIEFYGSSSEVANKKHYGGLADYRSSEGRKVRVKYRGKINDTVLNILAGVGGWAMVLWGIPLRLVFVYHITWLVNSATHCWGTIAYESGDNSKNNKWVAALTFGEGWHNNHHAFPNSAKHGLQRNQIDLTWQHIRFLKAIGLAKKIRLPIAS